jgi:hypothetical protein
LLFRDLIAVEHEKLFLLCKHGKVIKDVFLKWGIFLKKFKFKIEKFQNFNLKKNDKTLRKIIQSKMTFFAF